MVRVRPPVGFAVAATFVRPPRRPITCPLVPADQEGQCERGASGAFGSGEQRQLRTLWAFLKRLMRGAHIARRCASSAP